MNNLINIDVYKYYNKFLQLSNKYNNKEVVFFCAGNCKVWYDSFASCFASRLREIGIDCYIYGGKDFPIVPETINEYISWVEKKHPSACVFVVDNLLTFDVQDCGKLIISERKTNIAGLSQNLLFGDISILLTTNPRENCYRFLENQQIIVEDLIDSIKLLKKNNKNDKFCI